MQRWVRGFALSALGLVFGCASEPDHDADARRVEEEDASTGTSDPDGSISPSTDGTAPPVPDSWVTTKGGCGLSLTGPGLLAIPRMGVDSCVTSFASEGCSYEADLGSFSNPLRDFAADLFVVEEVHVDGKPARLVHSRSGGAQNDYFAGLHVPALWGVSSTVAVTITVSCVSEPTFETALRVLQTLKLPASDQAAAVPLQPTPSCTGHDERPIEGYALGAGCAESKLPVPGVCAFGAKTNNAIGTGNMLCFVTPDERYFWAFVKFGEYVVSTTWTRHGRGELWPNQLPPDWIARCEALTESLKATQGDAFAVVSGEYMAGACHQPARAAP